MTVPAGMSESLGLGIAEVMGVDGGDDELPSSLEHASATDRKASARERKKSILRGTTAPLSLEHHVAEQRETNPFCEPASL